VRENQMNKLITPFGNVVVKVNNEEVRYEVELSKTEYENKKYDLYTLKLNVLNLKINDKISFELENCKLDFSDSDERCETLTIENKELILGFTGYEPQYHENERLYHCYELYGSTDNGFEYTIERNPKEYQDEFKKSHIINVNVAWINKKEFEDYDTAINLITWF